MEKITIKEAIEKGFIGGAPKKNKYNNRFTMYKGICYQSMHEAAYAKELDMRMKAKNFGQRVIEWERQVPFPIVFNGVKICTYYADFRVRYDDGREEIVDCKGVITDVYALKKKLVRAQYGIDIIEK